MCRSKAQGGRRCAAASGGTPAPQRGAGTAAAPQVSRRAAAKEQLAEAGRAFREAKAALGGSPLNDMSGLVIGPLARQAVSGSPAAFDGQVQEGREQLTLLLVERGDSPAAAAEKVKALEAAYSTWHATPGAR